MFVLSSAHVLPVDCPPAPQESAEFHRVLEEPENHPHIKHFYDWRKQADAAGHGNAKAFRGKIPEDLIHYLVQDPGAAKQDL